jgi:hypothetical protein
LECGENVEASKHIEVWRDPEAVEKIIPVKNIRRSSEGYVIESDIGEVKIPRHIIHEKIVAMVRSSHLVYVKLVE